MSVSMAQRLQKAWIEQHYVLSMWKTCIQQILLLFLTSRYLSINLLELTLLFCLPIFLHKLIFRHFCLYNIFQHSIAIRSGHHCAQPLHRYLGVNASARASLHFYNTKEDVDVFIRALNDTISFFASFK